MPKTALGIEAVSDPQRKFITEEEGRQAFFGSSNTIDQEFVGRKGDTLQSISADFAIPESELRSRNGIPDDIEDFETEGFRFSIPSPKKDENPF